ncbi:hypothetical protein ACFE04_017866 [Oxalis oulophora]
MGYLGLFLVTTLVMVILPRIWQLFIILLWRPYALTRSFKKQGITGPPYKILSGSLHEIKKLKQGSKRTVLDTHSHDIVERVNPHFHRWSSVFGKTFLYFEGLQARIYIDDPEIAKQILLNKFGFYIKPQVRPLIYTFVGNGLVLVNGLDWVRHKRILNPAFSMDKLKVMIKGMTTCTLSMLEDWKSHQTEEKSKKIQVHKEFQQLTADIIAHSAFGSSFAQGKEVFSAQHELQNECAAQMTDIFIPGSQYIPTPANIRIWKLERRVKNTLRAMIESRLNSETPNGSTCRYGDDLLGLMIGSMAENNQTGQKMDMVEIMEECKTFFFAGHETTSNLLTWMVFLLSLYPEWQTKLREEVVKECGNEIPDADSVSKLRLVNMVLLETLRLYGPVMLMIRKASEDLTLKNLVIPKGTCITIPIMQIHHSKEYWGEDVNEFNPLRFADGISRATKHPNAMLAFSMGPRACIGQTFATLEAKTVIALILQRFSFSLSPEYKHTPVDHLTLQPQFGLPVIMKPLQRGIIE